MDSTVTTLTVFEFKGNHLEVIEHHGEPWFIGKQVCDALGFGNHRDALSNLSTHQRDYVGISDAMGRLRDTIIISEGGLYKLAFRSHKAEAMEFTDKVVDEILPAIRKTGMYDATGVIPQLSTQVQDLAQRVTRLEQQQVPQVATPSNLKAAVFEVITSKMQPGEKFKRRRIVERGNTFIRRNRAQVIGNALDDLTTDGQLDRFGKGRSACYWRSENEE